MQFPHYLPPLRRFIAGCLFALLIATGASHASNAPDEQPRNIQFASLTTEHGLSSEFVHDVVQDSIGYMWFATQAGLNRYDGHTIRVFENTANDPLSLSNSFVWSLAVDNKGQLWIGTERGLNRYDPEQDGFIRHPLNPDRLTNLRIRRIVQDRLGFLWLGTLGDGVFRVNPETGDTVHYAHDAAAADSLPGNSVIAMIEDSRGQLWIGTDGDGLARFDRPSESFIRYQHDATNSGSIGSNRIRSLYEDSSGKLWIGTAPGGLSQLNREAGTFRNLQHDPADPESLPSGQVSALFEDDNSTLWVGSESGLAEWRPASSSFHRYRRNPGDADSLVNDRINALTQDRSGVLWLGTHGGVSAWNYFSDTFRYYSSADGYLQSDLVTSIAESASGTLWVGTYGGGLTQIDPQDGSVTHHRLNAERADSLPDDRVMTVLVDNNDQLWVGTRAGGLARMIAPGRFERFAHNPDDPRSISGNAITRLHQASDGSLWVGVFDHGLSHLISTADGFEHFSHNPEDDSSLSGNRVLAIAQSPDGDMWFGTEGAGLNRYLGNGRFTRHTLESTNNGPAGTPWELHFANNGDLWIGSLGQGLFRWSRNNRAAQNAQFEQYSTQQGLSSSIFGITEGDAGELWLSSNRGLLRFEPSSKRVRKFDRQTGLRTNEFNQGAAYRSRSGRLLFGSQAGLVGYFPGDIRTNTRPPEIAVTARSRTDTIAWTHSDLDAPMISLDYFDAFVALDFVALDFVSPDKNRYRYRLVGLDDNWTLVDQYRQAIYSGLSPGNYTFEVQASNNDGIWNQAGASLDVYVVPPPWRSWWAYVIYTFMGFAIVGYYLARQRARRHEEARNRERLEHLVLERTSALAESNRELTDLNQKLEQTSITDALTGLRNRRFVDQHISAELSMLRRLAFEEPGEAERPDAPRLLFLMMIDLDGFKAINDTFGHHAGDRALLEVRDRLLATCRKSDAVVRWGGDEFLIIGHAQNFAGAETFAEKVRQSVDSEHYDVGDGNLGKLSASIGLAAIPFVDGSIEFATWEQVCGIADIGAYIVKKSSKNAWVSLLGTTRLAPADLATINDSLPAMIDAGKIRVNSGNFTDTALLETIREQYAEDHK